MLPALPVVRSGGSPMFQTALGFACRLALLTLAAVVMQGLAPGAPGVAWADGGDGEEGALPSVDAAGPYVAPPSYGVFYERYEPTFYAGFAPRMPDPERIHLHMGRGNQLRVTVVLSDPVLEAYARDLLTRHSTVRSLIDGGELKLSQNSAFEAMEATHRAMGLEALVAEEAQMPASAIRERNLALLERLNPGRIFRIRMPVDDVIDRWLGALAGTDSDRIEQMDPAQQLSLLDAMLPTRLFLDPDRLDAAMSAELKALVANAARAGATTRKDAIAAIRPAFLRLFERVTRGHYPLRTGALEFAEFTAVYPIGTANEFTRVKGREIPLYPTPGRRQLTTHQRSKTIDHIATVPTYSYSPWIPYMHVTPTMHNAFHTPYWELRPAKASFLPPALRRAPPKPSGSDRYPFAYLLSRGPASHGCTHVNPGHLVELRQILPAQTDRLDQVEVFLNKSELFDAFDIDGDFRPEVIGVRYFVAYSIVNDKPRSMRAPVERGPFYDWLYGGELRIGPDGTGFFDAIRDARFAGKKATDGALHERIPLYEAAYEPERIQFYASRPISFVRELRKVGVDHPFSAESARSDRAL